MLYLILKHFLGAYGLQFGTNTTAMKNKDADLNNPNINVYDSIEENDPKKNEHLYDEINFNNTIASTYDHLDRTRPQNLWRQNYQKMANGHPLTDGSSSSKFNAPDQV